jgi:hypothetical protein
MPVPRYVTLGRPVLRLVPLVDGGCATLLGCQTRRLAWLDFVEAFEFDFGKHDDRFWALFKHRLCMCW